MPRECWKQALFQLLENLVQRLVLQAIDVESAEESVRLWTGQDQLQD